MTSTTAARPAAARRPTGADLALALAGLGLLCLALIPVDIHRLFGLPAHPLLLHVPVVLVPLLGLTLLAAAARPALFQRHALAIGLFTVVSLGATILTVGAGAALRADRPVGGDEARRLAEHAESGETLRLIMVLLAGVVLTAVLLSQAREHSRLSRLSGIARSGRLQPILRALFAIGAVAAIFFTIRTGHLGAQLTWGDKGGDRPPAGLGHRDND